MAPPKLFDVIVGANTVRRRRPFSSGRGFEAFDDVDVGGLPKLAQRAYGRRVLRLLRFSILVMTVIVLSMVIAVARPETGPAEKVVLGSP